MHTHKQFLPMLREREVADKFGDTYRRYGR